MAIAGRYKISHLQQYLPVSGNYKMKYILCLLLQTLCLSSFGQHKIVNLDAANEDSAILFEDIINHIQFRGITDTDQVGIVCGKGTLTTIRRRNEYQVEVHNVSTTTVSMLKNIDDSFQNVLTKIFRVEVVGKPSIHFIQLIDTVYPSNHQRANLSRLEVTVPNRGYSNSYEVAHFEISLVTKNGKPILESALVSGKWVGESIMKRVKQLKKGDKIVFDQIIIRCRDCPYKKMETFSVVVK